MWKEKKSYYIILCTRAKNKYGVYYILAQTPAVYFSSAYAAAAVAAIGCVLLLEFYTCERPEF